MKNKGSERGRGKKQAETESNRKGREGRKIEEMQPRRETEPGSKRERERERERASANTVKFPQLPVIIAVHNKPI